MGIQGDKEKNTEQFVRNCLKVSLPPQPHGEEDGIEGSLQTQRAWHM